jgi:hypothetical protein
MEVDVTNLYKSEDGTSIVAVYDTLNLVKDQEQFIPYEAIATRKVMYELSEDWDALTAIIKEGAFQLNQYIFDLNIQQIREADPDCEYIAWSKEQPREVLQPQGAAERDHYGGLHDEIIVNYSSQARQNGNELLGGMDLPAIDEVSKEALQQQATTPPATEVTIVRV